jgi:general secretion pathway protein G
MPDLRLLNTGCHKHTEGQLHEEKAVRSASKGFTLIELVVVILIIAILAAVAAPKFFDSATEARKSGTRQSLNVLRDAIELYRAQNSAYPAAATFATDMRPYLKGPFPAVQIGPNQNANVVSSSQNPITAVEPGGAGWAYNPTTGDIVVNDATYIIW